LRLVPKPAGRIVSGRILLDGEDLVQKSEREIAKVRGKRVSIIMQDPMTSLNPVFSIGNQVGEAISIHQRLRGRKLIDRVREMLRLVSIPSPEVRMREYPHQMSGGMRQRIVGAMAVSCQPKVLIADEPTTSLDVTIQAQYLRLLKEVQKEIGVSIIFITHDFGIVAKMCDRVAVMYAGKIVESAEARELFSEPKHPYTVALLRSLPKVETRVDRLFSIEGQPPDLVDLPPGCSFAPRCSEVTERCKLGVSPPQVVINNNHDVSCWLAAS
jgi:oligopeptide/dipeptide ABC transporter ATP-binding protein